MNPDARAIYRMPVPACTGNLERANILYQQVLNFVDLYNKHMPNTSKKHVWVRYNKTKIVTCRSCGLWAGHLWQQKSDHSGQGNATEYLLGNPNVRTLQKFIGCGEIRKEAKDPVHILQQTKHIWSLVQNDIEQHVVQTIDPEQRFICPEVKPKKQKLARDNKVDGSFRTIAKKIASELTMIPDDIFQSINAIPNETNE